MVLPEDVRRFVRATGPEHDGIQREMADRAAATEFPTVGPEAGAVLRLLAGLTGADRVFEFGSGFGYSAYWFLRGMDGGGEVILTEVDADELAAARDFFDRAGESDRATFERGDAVAIVDDYEGPFDAALIDHQKERYAEAFERIRGKVRVGGVVVADNLMRGPIDFDALLTYLEDEDEAALADDRTRGVADYLDAVRDDPDYETTALPVGSGLAVSVRVR